MDKIAEYRRRLAALSIEGVDADSPSPAKSLADCRLLEGRLRELKREVLERIAALRAEVRERARASLEPRPSLREVWQRRSVPPKGDKWKEGAKKLLSDVQLRVIGLVDGKRGDAGRALGQINQEIDRRLARLAELEARLKRVAEGGTGARRDTERPPTTKAEAEDPGGDDIYAAVGAEARPPKAEAEDPGDDDLYAAVGAEVRKEGPRGAYCPHCGRGLGAGDRYCRRCGHRLA